MFHHTALVSAGLAEGLIQLHKMTKKCIISLVGKTAHCIFSAESLHKKAFMHSDFSAFLIYLMKNYLRAKMLLFMYLQYKRFLRSFTSTVHSWCYWTPQMLVTIPSLHDRLRTQICKAQIWPSCAVDRCLTIHFSFLLLPFWTPRRAKASCKKI